MHLVIKPRSQHSLLWSRQSKDNFLARIFPYLRRKNINYTTIALAVLRTQPIRLSWRGYKKDIRSYFKQRLESERATSGLWVLANLVKQVKKWISWVNYLASTFFSYNHCIRHIEQIETKEQHRQVATTSAFFAKMLLLLLLLIPGKDRRLINNSTQIRSVTNISSIYDNGIKTYMIETGQFPSQKLDTLSDMLRPISEMVGAIVRGPIKLQSRPTKPVAPMIISNTAAPIIAPCSCIKNKIL